MASESTFTFETDVTLVSNLQLVFSKDNPSNTVLTPINGSGPCYSAAAKTRDGKDMITTYRKSEEPTDDWENKPIIASLQWREFFSDKISFAGKSPSSTSSVFKKRILST